MQTKTIIAEAGQNIADIAIQEFGSIDALLYLCLDNNLELGAEVEAGKSLIVKSEHIIDKKTFDYYTRKKHKPASGGFPYSANMWILETGFWDDGGIWEDKNFWKDGI